MALRFLAGKNKGISHMVYWYSTIQREKVALLMPSNRIEISRLMSAILSLAIDISGDVGLFRFFLFQNYFDMNTYQGSTLSFAHLPNPRQHDKPLPLILVPKLLSILRFLLLSPGAHGQQASSKEEDRAPAPSQQRNTEPCYHFKHVVWTRH